MPPLALIQDGGPPSLAPALLWLALGLPLVGLVLPRVGVRLAGPTAPEPAPTTWGVAEILALLAVLFVVVDALGSLVAGVFDPSPLNGLVTMSVANWLTCALGLVLVRLSAVQLAKVRGERPAPGELRVRIAQGFGLAGGLAPRRAMGFGAVALALAVPAMLGLMLLTPIVLEALGRAPEVQAVLADVTSQRGTSLALGFVLAGIVGPALEEILFRGFFQSALVARLGVWPGIVSTSVVFALLHGYDAALPIFALSLLLGWLRVRTGRLEAAIVAHCAWNLMTLALVILFA